MTKPEWGLKRKCLKCGSFFYDMRKEAFSCPKCKEQYTLESYEEAKNKQLLKLAKKAAPKIEDEDLDEEALLQMTEDIPLGDEEIPSDNLDLLEEEDMERTDPDISDIMDTYGEEKNDH